MQPQPQPQPIPALNSVPQLPLNAVTTEQIQKCLDDNKNLILAILENQNLGKLAECAQYQAILQKNLMYLAAIADAQQPPQGSVSSQQHQGVVQSPTQQMQKTQATNLQQQQVPPKLPFQQQQQQQPNNGSGFPSQEQQQQQQQQQMLQFHHQQQFQGHQAVNNAAMHHQLMRPSPANGLEANSDGLNNKLPPGQGGGGRGE